MTSRIRLSGLSVRGLLSHFGTTPFLNTVSLTSVRGLKRWDEPPTYDPIDLPLSERRLATLEKQPVYPFGVRAMKEAKELEVIRGPERVNNRLLYDQYGVITLCGGFLRPGHIDMIRNTINRQMNFTKAFAVWRIDPPYKPITKKGQGKRMGKGKGAIDHYVTPVKAGRILFEVGGTIDFKEVEPLLQEVCYKLPVDAIPVSKAIFTKIEAKIDAKAAANINPFNLRRVIDYNMHGSDVYIGKYDKQHYGDYI
ncbi:39S ribosomal protein L16, mitochondrial-like [Varroa jacobsoni]|uniref:Large ribosomal subunit protein uL16m n=1 Tax=Varroa destructor TaxID=109461 RepID=A0A7M7JJF5_VARDE|nr:39S ribosomal protein L16, mitochondrial-like [Varroa destructor]XP_022709946.1 39S ribosomal protein L16, mitochondrial-like [Varroa jacobsoni]